MMRCDLPRFVTTPGRYLTRGGEIVTVESVDRGEYGASGRYADGTPESWHPSGRVLPFSESSNDIVAVAPPENP